MVVADVACGPTSSRVTVPTPHIELSIWELGTVDGHRGAGSPGIELSIWKLGTVDDHRGACSPGIELSIWKLGTVDDHRGACSPGYESVYFPTSPEITCTPKQ